MNNLLRYEWFDISMNHEWYEIDPPQRYWLFLCEYEGGRNTLCGVR